MNLDHKIEKHELVSTTNKDNITKQCITRSQSVKNVVLSRDPGELLGHPGPHLDELAQVTGVAEQVVAQGVASLVRLVSQLHLAVLADVTINVEVLLHGDYSDCLLSALHWGDALTTGSTLGSKDSMKVIDTVDLVVEVNSEGNSIKTVITDAASEAARMICLPDCLEDALHDQMTTNFTFL